jgi:WD40 repeat protein
LSPDGEHLASVSYDKTARLWDCKTGECKRIWTEHKDRINCAAWDSVRGHLLTGSIDGVVKAWSPASQDSIWTWKSATGTGNASLLNVSPKGNMLVVNGAVLKYDDRAPIFGFSGNYGSIYHGEFTPDGRRVIVAGVDCCLRIWDLSSNQEILRLEHDGPVFSFAISADGKQIVSVGRDRVARIWDARSE